MKAAVTVFPGSNCDRDVAVALAAAGADVTMVWHEETALPRADLVVVPGGFSYGDYLRSGALAARSPVMRAVTNAAQRGQAVLGICNGFQILTEAGLLPGALMRNRGMGFICDDAELEAGHADGPFAAFAPGERVRFPIAHKDGCFFADDTTLDALEGDGRVAFRYAGANPNGSSRGIAGVASANGRVLGLMPHPERAADPATGGTDGARFFAGLAARLAA